MHTPLHSAKCRISQVKCLPTQAIPRFPSLSIAEKTHLPVWVINKMALLPRCFCLWPCPCPDSLGGAVRCSWSLNKPEPKTLSRWHLKSLQLLHWGIIRFMLDMGPFAFPSYIGCEQKSTQKLFHYFYLLHIFKWQKLWFSMQRARERAIERERGKGRKNIKPTKIK